MSTLWRSESKDGSLRTSSPPTGVEGTEDTSGGPVGFRDAEEFRGCRERRGLGGVLIYSDRLTRGKDTKRGWSCRVRPSEGGETRCRPPKWELGPLYRPTLDGSRRVSDRFFRVPFLRKKTGPHLSSCRTSPQTVRSRSTSKTSFPVEGRDAVPD